MSTARRARTTAPGAALRGTGVWTAEWLLARTLGRPRVAAGDLTVRKAVGLAYLHALVDGALAAG